MIKKKAEKEPLNPRDSKAHPLNFPQKEIDKLQKMLYEAIVLGIQEGNPAIVKDIAEKIYIWPKENLAQANQLAAFEVLSSIKKAILQKKKQKKIKGDCKDR